MWKLVWAYAGYASLSYVHLCFLLSPDSNEVTLQLYAEKFGEHLIVKVRHLCIGFFYFCRNENPSTQKYVPKLVASALTTPAFWGTNSYNFYAERVNFLFFSYVFGNLQIHPINIFLVFGHLYFLWFPVIGPQASSLCSCCVLLVFCCNLTLYLLGFCL